jgi:hypothetical protein
MWFLHLWLGYSELAAEMDPEWDLILPPERLNFVIAPTKNPSVPIKDKTISWVTTLVRSVEL